MTFPLEIFPTLTGNVGGGARICSGGVGSFNGAGISAKDSSQFIRVNSSMVITTRSDGSPTGYGSTFSVKSEGKARFNVKNISPFKSLCTKGIYENHSFISDFEAWPLNNAVNEQNNGRGHNECEKKFPEIRRSYGLNQRTRNQEVPDKGYDQRRLRAKNFNVRHRLTPTCQVKLHD